MNDLQYSDGNGNWFTITQDLVAYRGVRPEESSSGVYSGGEDKKVAISSVQRKEIQQLFQDATENSDIHIQNRLMMSGQIVVGHDKFILKPGCEEMIAIENYLRSILR